MDRKVPPWVYILIPTWYEIIAMVSSFIYPLCVRSGRKLRDPAPDTKNVPNCGGVYWRAASATRKYFANYLRLALVERCSTLHLEWAIHTIGRKIGRRRNREFTVVIISLDPVRLDPLFLFNCSDERGSFAFLSRQEYRRIV